MQDPVYGLRRIRFLGTSVNIEEDFRHSSSTHPPLLHCEQRSLRQRKVATLVYDREREKPWQDYVEDTLKTRRLAYDSEST